MTDTLHFRYQKDDGRIGSRYWGENAPEQITDPPEGYGYASEPGFSQDGRGELLREAKADVEPGEDYDPDSEAVVAHLYYEPDDPDFEGGRIYGKAEIVDLPDDND